jgi:hypothetical protein
MAKLDKRQGAPRVPSHLVVVENGQKGVMRDVSATGIFFEIDAKHESGSVIQFHVELDTPGGKLKLMCEGEVVRVEHLNGKVGVAAKILKQEFIAI